MSEHETMIAVYRLHEEANSAIQTLRKMGFETSDISIAGRNFHTVETVVGYRTTNGVVKPCGRLGPFWKALLKPYSESALLWVPDLGPVGVAGALVSRIVQASEEHVIVHGLTTFGVALYSMGIPEYGVLSCEDAIRSDHFVLVIQGHARAVDSARNTLAGSHAELIEIELSSM